MNWGHRVPFEEEPGLEGWTQHQLQAEVNDLRRKVNRLEDENANLKSENARLTRKPQRRWW